MIVRDLITLLQVLPPDALVVMSKDGEGNSFSPLCDVAGENQVYIPDSTYSGEVRFGRLTQALEHRGYTEEDCAEDGDDVQVCVVLWPTN